VVHEAGGRIWRCRYSVRNSWLRRSGWCGGERRWRGVPACSRLDPKLPGRPSLAQSPNPDRIQTSNTKLISRRHGERTRGAPFCRAARWTRGAIMFFWLMRSRWRTVFQHRPDQRLSSCPSRRASSPRPFSRTHRCVLRRRYRSVDAKIIAVRSKWW